MGQKEQSSTKRLKTSTAKISRWLHIYLSMASFVIVLFFAITGLTLNHADWFNGNETIQSYNGKVNVNWVDVEDTSRVAKYEIVQFLKRNYNIQGTASDFFIGDAQCVVSFKGPGYSADAFINRDTGEFQITETKLGLVAVLNDLHKGRDTGGTWSVIIDISAIFLCLLSITGITMLIMLTKKRLKGLLTLAAGALFCFVIYILFIP